MVAEFARPLFPAILATSMSFAAAVYSSDGRDIAIGADGLWCLPLSGGSYRPIPEHPAVKCLRLCASTAVAFTGSASLIRSLLARIYEDDSILAIDEMDVGVRLEGCDIAGAPSMVAVADRVDDVLPGIIESARGTPAADDLSVTLAGRLHGGNPGIMGWSEETEWKRHLHQKEDGLGWMTLPPDGEKYRPQIDALFGDNKLANVPSVKIHAAIARLTAADDVVTVGGRPTVRTLRRGFLVA